MKYRHKGSGKEYSAEEMEKACAGGGSKKEDYEEMGKSELPEDELRKSVEALEAQILKGDRKGELLAKAAQDKLSEDENAELYKILGGGGGQPLADDVVKSWLPEGDDTIAKALEVSDYLNSQHKASTDSLRVVADHIEKSGNGQHEFNLVLAKSLIDTSRLAIEQHQILKSVAARLGLIEQQPARAPKSQIAANQPPAQPLDKSLGGAPPVPQWSKGQVLQALTDINMSGQRISKSGEPLLHAITKFEQFNMISPTLLQEAQAHLAGKANGAVQ